MKRTLQGASPMRMAKAKAMAQFPVRAGLLMMLALSLSACDGKLTVPLSAEPPSTAVEQVVVTVSGVSLQRSDDSEDQITLSTPVQVNLLTYNVDPFQLLTAEQISANDYVGIRLLYVDSTDNDNDNYIVSSTGVHVPLTISADPTIFQPLDLTVEKNKGKSYTVDMRLDLRLSLSTASDGADPTLTPVARAVRDTDANTIEGTVSNALVTASSCEDGRNAGVGVAIYAFVGDSVTPHDHDGTENDPVASASVLETSAGNWRYTFSDMVSGDYTLALTCQADLENSLIDDNLVFNSTTHNVTVNNAETQTQDFN